MVRKEVVLEGPKDSAETQNNWFLDRVTNPLPAEYEAGMLTVQKIVKALIFSVFSTCLVQFSEWSFFFNLSNLCSHYSYKTGILYVWLYSPRLGLGCFFSFLILYTVCRTPWTGISPSQGRYLHTGQHKHRINAYTQTFVPGVGFETTISEFERGRYFMP
jgi:hypothetical protein